MQMSTVYAIKIKLVDLRFCIDWAGGLLSIRKSLNLRSTQFTWLYGPEFLIPEQ